MKFSICFFSYLHSFSLCLIILLASFDSLHSCNISMLLITHLLKDHLVYFGNLFGNCELYMLKYLHLYLY
jgi:hypothetical protein